MGKRVDKAPSLKRELKKVLAEVCSTPVLGDAYEHIGSNQRDALILVGDERYPKQPWYLDITPGVHHTLGIRTISAAFSGNAFGDTIVQFHAYLPNEPAEHEANFDGRFRIAPPRQIITPFDQHDIRKKAAVTEVSDTFLAISVEEGLTGDQYLLTSVETTQPIREKKAQNLAHKLGFGVLQLANNVQSMNDRISEQSFSRFLTVQ